MLFKTCEDVGKDTDIIIRRKRKLLYHFWVKGVTPITMYFTKFLGFFYEKKFKS